MDRLRNLKTILAFVASVLLAFATVTSALHHAPASAADDEPVISKACERTLQNPWAEITSKGVVRSLEYVVDEVDGDRYLQMTSTRTDPITGEVKKSKREIPEDWLTSSFDYNTKKGKELLEAVLDSIAESGRQLALIFVDLNDLGEVNKFEGLQVTGNDFIASAIGKELRRNVREDDLVFRIGGDEWMVLLPDISEQDLISFMNRVNLAILESPGTNNIFEDQRNYLEARISAARAESYERQGLVDALQELSKLKPSVVQGSTFYRQGDTFRKILARTSEQAYSIKKNYKQRAGLDVSGYGAITRIVKEEDNAIPMVLPPVR